MFQCFGYGMGFGIQEIVSFMLQLYHFSWSVVRDPGSVKDMAGLRQPIFYKGPSALINRKSGNFTPPEKVPYIFVPHQRHTFTDHGSRFTNHDQH